MKEYSKAPSFIFPKLLQPLGAKEISTFNPLDLFPGGIPDYIAPKKNDYGSKPFFYENRSLEMPIAKDKNELGDRPQQIQHFSQVSVVNPKSNVSANLSPRLFTNNLVNRPTNNFSDSQPQLDSHSDLDRHAEISPTNSKQSTVEEADILKSNSDNESSVNNLDPINLHEIKRSVVEPDIAPQLKITDVYSNESSAIEPRLDSKQNVEANNPEYVRQSDIQSDITPQSTVSELQNIDDSNLHSDTVSNISLNKNSTTAPKLDNHHSVTDAIDEQQSIGDQEKITPQLNNKYNVETKNPVNLPHAQQPTTFQDIVTPKLNKLNTSTQDRVITPQFDVVSNVDLDEATIVSNVLESNDESKTSVPRQRNISNYVLSEDRTVAPKLSIDSDEADANTTEAIENQTSELNSNFGIDNNDRAEEIPQPTISQEIVSPKLNKLNTSTQDRVITSQSDVVSNVDRDEATTKSNLPEFNDESKTSVPRQRNISNYVLSEDRTVAPKLSIDSDEADANTTEAIENQTSKSDNNSNIDNSDRLEEIPQPTIPQDIVTPELNTSTQERVITPKSDIVSNIDLDEATIASKISPSDSEDISNSISPDEDETIAPKLDIDSEQSLVDTTEVVEDATSKLNNNLNIDNRDRLDHSKIQQLSESQEIIAPQSVNIADSNAKGEAIARLDSVHNTPAARDRSKIPSQPDIDIASEISHNSNRDRQDNQTLQPSTEKEAIPDVDNTLDAAASEESAISKNNRDRIDFPNVRQTAVNSETVALNNDVDSGDRQNFSEAKESIINRATIASQSTKNSPDFELQDELAPLSDSNAKIKSDRLDRIADAQQLHIEPESTESNPGNISPPNLKEQQTQTTTPQSTEPTTVIYSKKINPIVVHSSLNNKAIAPKLKPITNINSSLLIFNKGQKTDLKDNSLINPKSLPLFLKDNSSSKKTKNQTKNNLAVKTALPQQLNIEKSKDSSSDHDTKKNSENYPDLWSSLSDLVSRSSISDRVDTKQIKTTKTKNYHNQINSNQEPRNNYHSASKKNKISPDKSATVRLSIERSSIYGYQYQTLNPQIARSPSPPELLTKVEEANSSQPENITVDNQNNINLEDEEEYLDILAEEIYELIQHKLTIEKERFGQYYR